MVTDFGFPHFDSLNGRISDTAHTASYGGVSSNLVPRTSKKPILSKSERGDWANMALEC